MDMDHMTCTFFLDGNEVAKITDITVGDLSPVITVYHRRSSVSLVSSSTTLVPSSAISVAAENPGTCLYYAWRIRCINVIVKSCYIQIMYL
jgi:hypothetical protein